MHPCQDGLDGVCIDCHLLRMVGSRRLKLLAYFGDKGDSEKLLFQIGIPQIQIYPLTSEI